jgi:hypothetical protein
VNPFYILHPLWPAATAARWDIALALFAAHLLGDFVFQPDWMVAEKRNPPVLLAHALIHGCLALALFGQWSRLPVAVLVAASHGAIDFLKSRHAQPRQRDFWIDQAGHVLVLVALAAWFGSSGAITHWSAVWGQGYRRLLIFACGGILCVRTSAVAIGFWVQRYLEEIVREPKGGVGAEAARGLSRGGRIIGQWERALIFGFVVTGQPTAVGFLIAAKSIFRFGELTDRTRRMEAEYITIGTLMSFGMALFISWATVLAFRP